MVYTADLFDRFASAGYSTAVIGKNHSRLAPDDADRWFELSHWGANGPCAREDASKDH